MRADRLLSILMLLQTRGRITARQAAQELEVSERTIYRDVVALSAAGVPVYTDRGPGGGISLLEDYRTTLTGLTANELRALFMLSIPAPLEDLGVGQELKAALLKLTAALPEGRRGVEAQARQRIHLDALPWERTAQSVPYLHLIQQAVWQDQRLRLAYQAPFGTRIETVAEPYGLVAKAAVWYLVCACQGHLRVVGVSRVMEAALLPETFTRPPDFDLAAFWQEWCAASQAERPHYRVSARLEAALLPGLPRQFGEAIRTQIEQAAWDELGRVTLELTFNGFESALRRFLSWGRAAEVLAPRPLRLAVADYAGQIIARYGE